MAVGLGYHMWDVTFSDFGFDFQVVSDTISEMLHKSAAKQRCR
jgi:hypothetical protein